MFIRVHTWLILPLAILAHAQTPAASEKTDKADAYYHYMLAVMNAGDPDKIAENLDAAKKADPQAPTTVPTHPRLLLPFRPGVAPSILPPPPVLR